uniref:Uncharacterized protein n=1 Tax=Octopus bimaculoides TaxID=37653 RepID=A0A0L8GS33_OCTBM
MWIVNTFAFVFKTSFCADIENKLPEFIKGSAIFTFYICTHPVLKNKCKQTHIFTRVCNIHFSKEVYIELYFFSNTLADVSNSRVKQTTKNF